MAKSLSGVDKREGSSVSIGDNRYGLREAYDTDEEKRTKDYYKKGDKVSVKEVKNKLTGKVKTTKP